MTTTATSQITLLSAINEMLSAVNIAEVSTLASVSTNEDAQKAVNTISDVAVQVQSERWAFNTEEEFPLNPSPVDGTISLPANSQFLGLHWRSSNRRATVRGSQVYDLENHTYQWANGSNGIKTPDPLTNVAGSTVTYSQAASGGLGVLYVNLQFYLPFESLPQAIRWLVLCRAARMFAVGRVPDSLTFKFTETLYDEAYAFARSWDNEAAAEEYFVNPHLRFMGTR